MKVYDVAITGAGPAGLQAAIYCARAGKKVLLLDKGWPAHLLKMRCENYLGFPKGISGKELLERGLAQAKKFGTKLKREQVLGIKKIVGGFELKTPDTKYRVKKILIATGKAIRPVLKNENKFVGKGVSYCVPCDGPFFKNKKVGVIGAGDFAANEALELLNYTKNITIFTNGQDLEVSVKLKKELEKNKIKIVKNKIAQLAGNKFLQKIILEGKEEKVSGVFMAVGFASSLDFARALGLEIEGIFLVANKKQETSVKEIWAAGDCTGPPFQIAKAIGEAAIAALNMTGKTVQY